MINFLLGMFTTSTILLIIFIIKFCDFKSKSNVKEKTELTVEQIKKLPPDKAIDKSDFFR